MDMIRRPLPKVERAEDGHKQRATNTSIKALATNDEQQRTIANHRPPAAEHDHLQLTARHAGRPHDRLTPRQVDPTTG